MSGKWKIAVCDDEEKRAKSFHDKITALVDENWEVVPVDKTTLENGLREVRNRASLDSKGQECVFDKIDVVILDNDLRQIKDHAFDGAETFFGQLRAFTSSQFLISLNLDMFNDFDLAFLGHIPSTNADMAINDRHLSLKSVWERGAHAFSPWYWPDVAATLRTRDVRRAEIVKAGLNESLWNFFDFGGNSERAFGVSDSVFSRLDPVSPLKEITFESCFRNGSRYITARLRQELLERYNNSADKDRSPFLEPIVRVVEAEIYTWLRRYMLTPQSLLVDLPHLVSILPRCLGSAADLPQLQNWNRVVTAQSEPFGCDPAVFERHLRPAIFSRRNWFDRPVFWMNDLKSDSALYELDAEIIEPPDFVFLEDRSKFANSEHAVAYDVSLDTGMKERYVSAEKMTNADGEEMLYAPRGIRGSF